LFVPGLFADSRFYLNSRGLGPARFFVDHGFSALLAELRGHGGSRAPSGAAPWSFDEHATEDLPALVAELASSATRPAFVLAHSFGGYLTLAALGLRPELQAALAGVVVLGSAVNDYSDGGFGKRLALPAAAWISRVTGAFPARRLRLGSSDESSLLMQQFASWAKRRAFDSRDGRIDYFRALERVKLPVFAGVGSADRFHASPTRARALFERLGSEQKTFVVFGPGGGPSRAFGHIDLVRGVAAEQEVLPRILEWLNARACSASPQMRPGA